MGDPKLTRRELLRGGFAAAGVAAASTVETGCAGMPRAGGKATAHPCDHKYCRYHQAADGGRCTLKVRLGGGEP